VGYLQLPRYLSNVARGLPYYLFPLPHCQVLVSCHSYQHHVGYMGTGCWSKLGSLQQHHDEERMFRWHDVSRHQPPVAACCHVACGPCAVTLGSHIPQISCGFELCALNETWFRIQLQPLHTTSELTMLLPTATMSAESHHTSSSPFWCHFDALSPL
jgi:hypothetical protein